MAGEKLLRIRHPEAIGRGRRRPGDQRWRYPVAQQHLLIELVAQLCEDRIGVAAGGGVQTQPGIRIEDPRATRRERQHTRAVATRGGVSPESPRVNDPREPLSLRDPATPAVQMDELHARVDLQRPLQARRDSRLEQAPDLDLAPSGQQLDLRAAERVRADRDEEELVSVEDGAERSYRRPQGAAPRESTDATSLEGVVTH